MRGLTFINKGKTYKQISKRRAKKLYLQDIPVVMCPSNLRPFTAWHCEHVLRKRDRAQFTLDDTGAANDFDNYVNSFEWYNCRDNETGKYTRFYVEVCWSAWILSTSTRREVRNKYEDGN